MSALIHRTQEARELKYSHLAHEVERPRRSRKPIYSRTTARTTTSAGFHRRQSRRTG
jgi:hypothetical protein